MISTLAWAGLLVGAPATADTYHVASSDKNGDGVADQDGTCPAHPNVGSAWSSCVDAVASGCTLDKPCCTIQDALERATGPGDIVEVHAGTFDHAIDGTSASVTLGGDVYQAMNAVRACSACTSESSRRVIRGAVMGTTDRPRIRAGTGSGIEMAFVLGTSRTDDVRYVTLEGFEIVEFAPSGFANGAYFGIIQNKGDASYAIFKGLHIHDTGSTRFGQCAIAIGGTSGEEFSSDAMYSDYGLIEDVTVGPNHGGNTVCFDSVGQSCQLTGWVIRNSRLATTVDTGAGTGYFRAKGLCGVLHNNYFDCEDSQDCEAHFRENSGPIYLFNNYFRHAGDLFYLQCSSSQCSSGLRQDILFFNNTILRVGTEANPDGFDPIEGDGMADVSRHVNNLWVGHDSPYNCSGNSSANLGAHGFNAYNGRAYHANCSSGAVAVQLGPHLTAGFPHHQGTGAFPVPFLQLRDGSSAIDAGTNDPLGQGAGNCSINTASRFGCSDAGAAVCQPVDCTVDFDGDARGTSWDIGADEHGAQSSGSVPPPLGVRRGEGEEP